MKTPPRTRGDCKRGPRPCPWIDCRYHLREEQVAAVGRAGADGPPLDTSQSCALDVADLARASGGYALHEVAAHFGMTAERIRQVEELAILKARAAAEALGVSLDVLGADHGETADWSDDDSGPFCACGCGSPVGEKSYHGGPGKVYATRACGVKARNDRRTARQQDRISVLNKEQGVVCACGCGAVVPPKTRGGPARIYANEACQRRAAERRRRAARKVA